MKPDKQAKDGSARAERLARALRGNLRRRKATADEGPEAVLRRQEAIAPAGRTKSPRRPNCDENGQ
jgi:hypothetical protein